MKLRGNILYSNNRDVGIFGEGMMNLISKGKNTSTKATTNDGFMEAMKRINAIDKDRTKAGNLENLAKGSFMERYKEKRKRDLDVGYGLKAVDSDFNYNTLDDSDKSDWLNRKNFNGFKVDGKALKLREDDFELVETSVAVDAAAAAGVPQSDNNSANFNDESFNFYRRPDQSPAVEIESNGFKVVGFSGTFERVPESKSNAKKSDSYQPAWLADVNRLRDIASKISKYQEDGDEIGLSIRIFSENRDLYFESLEEQVSELKRSLEGGNHQFGSAETDPIDGRHPVTRRETLPVIVAKPLDMKKLNDPNVRDAVTIQTLMQASVHLGHNVEKFNRTMVPFVMGQRESLAIIDLEKTLFCLRRAIQVVRDSARLQKIILFVGSRRFLTKLTRQVAMQCNQFYINEEYRTGTLLNVEVTTGTRLLPDLVVCLSMQKDERILFECERLMIPTIAICDTDCNAGNCTYPIPANDDSLSSVGLIANSLSYAAMEGHNIAMGKESSVPIPMEVARLMRKTEIQTRTF